MRIGRRPAPPPSRKCLCPCGQSCPNAGATRLNKDAAAIARAFKAIPAAVKKAVQPAIEKGADEIAARIRYLAPDATGDLKANVRVEPGPQELSATIVS